MSDKNEEVIVYIQPLKSITEYDSEVEVTDFIEVSSLPEVNQTSDSSDYDIGIFVFGDVELNLNNGSGKFNSAGDSRSIFGITRDLAKVRVVFRQTQVTRNSTGVITSTTVTDTNIFRGIVNEEATRINFNTEEITLRILSPDSVIRNDKIIAGQIPNGTLASDAIKFILNKPRITNLLNFDPLNIALDQDFIIDDGSQLDNVTSFDAIGQILVLANSVLIIDDSLDIFVKSRDPDTSVPTLNLFGPFDEKGRGNIIDLREFNTGQHRMFNSVKVNNSEVNDSGYTKEFGLRQKSITTSFVTNTTTETSIANTILNGFKEPRDELIVDVPFETAKDSILFQRVSINWPLRYSIDPNKFPGIYGQTTYSEDEMPYVSEDGAFEINPSEQFKIIEKSILIDSRTISLKLRQTSLGYTS